MFIGFALQESCLKNLMGRRAWQATIHGDAQSQTQRGRPDTIHMQHAVDSTLNIKIHQKKLGRYRVRR